MPSCKWPVPMHTRSPCGTSSTVNAPSQHPGRFNPPYTYKHVPGCACRRVVPASTLPSVARNKFCCGFLPGSSQRLFQGATGDAQRTASVTAVDFPPLAPLSCLGGFLVPSRDSISSCMPLSQFPLTQSLSISFHVLPSCACSPFTGNLSSRVVPVTYCFQAVSNARCRGGALVFWPLPRPLAWSPNIAYCLWLLAGLHSIR